MSDIAMCASKTCPKRYKCYRFMAKPDPIWQVYGKFRYYKAKKHCDGFLPIYKEPK